MELSLPPSAMACTTVTVINDPIRQLFSLLLLHFLPFHFLLKLLISRLIGNGTYKVG